jgi:hypothetical protein
MSNGQTPQKGRSLGKSWLDANASEDSILHNAALGNIQTETDTLKAGDSTHVETALKGIYGPVSKYVTQESLYGDYSDIYSSLNTLSGRNMTGFDPIDYATKNKMGNPWELERAVRGGSFEHYAPRKGRWEGFSSSKAEYDKGKKLPGFSQWQKKGRPSIENYFYDLAFSQNLRATVDLGAGAQNKKAGHPSVKAQMRKLKEFTGDSYEGYMKDIVKSSIAQADKWASEYSLETQNMMGKSILAVDNRQITNEVRQNLTDLNKVVNRKAEFEKTKASLNNIKDSETQDITLKILKDEENSVTKLEDRILFNIDASSGKMTRALGQSLENMMTIQSFPTSAKRRTQKKKIKK